MFDQRRITPAHERYVTKRTMSPSRDYTKNHVDRRQSNKPLRAQQNSIEIESELAQMELEESGVYRNAGTTEKPRKDDWLWGEKLPPSDTDRERQYTDPKRPVYGVSGPYKP